MKILISFLLFISFAFTKEINPVMLYDTDLIFDKSWNEAIYNGIKKFERKSNVKVKVISASSIKESNRLVKKLAKDGYNPIMISHTDYIDSAIKETISQNPKTRFIILNGYFDMPNAHYLSFSNQESSFLAGYMAMKKSKTKRIGFIGGANIAVINNFLCGYIKGAKFVNNDALVDVSYVGKGFEAWISPKKAYSLAKEQIKNGADVIFSAAGGSTIGALEASAESNILSIGVDKNQNHLFPGKILTSVMVRVDNAVFRALMSAKRNIWGEQKKVMGLQERGVQLAFDEHNKPLISKELKAQVDNLSAEIILKNIKLPYYTDEKKCELNGKILF